MVPGLWEREKKGKDVLKAEENNNGGRGGKEREKIRVGNDEKKWKHGTALEKNFNGIGKERSRARKKGRIGGEGDIQSRGSKILLEGMVSREGGEEENQSEEVGSRWPRGRFLKTRKREYGKGERKWWGGA